LPENNGQILRKGKGMISSALPIEITLDCASKVPLSRQLTDLLRRAIIESEIPCDTLLPSVRELALKLNVSRSTVMRCFDELAGQGYIVTTVGSGTRVCPRLPGDLEEQFDIPRVSAPANAAAFETRLSRYAQRLNELGSCLEPPAAKLLNPGGPLTNAAPIDRWRKLFEKRCRNQDSTNAVGDAHWQSLLSTAYASYLARTRAIRCKSDQVFVFTARELRLDLICRLLLEPGDLVAVENPGYPGARQRFAAHGARVLPIPVDHQGLDVDFLIQSSQPVRIVYVTPSHHEPTGVVMPIARRRKLLQWAQENDAFVVEDDYDSEYRYDSRPIPSLTSLDQTDSVIHLSCLWKVLSPVSKIGFLVVPNCLVEIFRATKNLVEREVPLTEQLVLTDFINEGHLERHIRKNRTLYAGRRQALVDALKNHLGTQITMSSESAGMDLFVKFNFGLADERLINSAQLAGLRMIDAKPYYIGEKPQGEFIIPFSLLTEEQISDSVKRFAQQIKQS
jgi:GntR family transcriptional regulator/MocR family aminotransferase